MNIYQKINEVRKLVEYVEKEKKVDTYKAVTHDQITALTRKHFVDQGIIIVPNVLRSAVKETGTTTSRGTPFVRLEVTYRFDVVNADEPLDRFSADIEAHALDQGDKAPGKALSYAKKALILKLLEIESGDADEDREEQHKAKEATKATPNAGAGETLNGKQKSMIRDTATMIGDALNEDRDVDALGYYETVGDLEEKLYLWSLLDSKQRRRIKEQGDRSKGKPN